MKISWETACGLFKLGPAYEYTVYDRSHSWTCITHGLSITSRRLFYHFSKSCANARLVCVTFLSVAPEKYHNPLMGPLQIAPAEAPDAKVRMVIITGPPEAQFKVCAPELCASVPNGWMWEMSMPSFQELCNLASPWIYLILSLKKLWMETENNS